MHGQYVSDKNPDTMNICACYTWTTPLEKLSLSLMKNWTNLSLSYHHRDLVQGEYFLTIFLIAPRSVQKKVHILLKIQEGQLSVSGKRMCTSTGLPLRGLSLHRKRVVMWTDHLDMTLKVYILITVFSVWSSLCTVIGWLVWSLMAQYKSHVKVVSLPNHTFPGQA